LENNVPQQYKTLGMANLIGGIVNVTFGAFIASTVWSLGAGTCTTVCTFGLCPIGFMFGFIGMLVWPVGMIEIVIGALTLMQPESVKGVYKFLPFAQFGGILLGDFVSPLLGVVGIMMTRDPEVAAYIEGI
jgi:hypothetical protein